MKFLRASRGFGDLERISCVLDGAGIAYIVRNEMTVAGSTAVPDFTPELWVVDDEKLEEARELVSASEHSPAKPGPPWVCPICGETIDGEFDSCWRCAGESNRAELAEPGPGLSRGSLLAILVILFALGAVLFTVSDTRRRWRVAQTKPVVDGMSLAIDDLCLYAHGGQNVLRLFCHWLGGNPADRYYMNATLRTSPSASAPEEKLAWHAGLFGRLDFRSPSPFIWELSNAPTAASKLYVRLHYQSMAAGSTPQSIDFEIPNLPRIVPTGELPGRSQLPYRRPLSPWH